jgi:hypothetical protein
MTVPVPDESGLHGVYPEQYVEILPLHFIQGQNDRRRRVRNDRSKHNLEVLTFQNIVYHKFVTLMLQKC